LTIFYDYHVTAWRVADKIRHAAFVMSNMDKNTTYEQKRRKWVEDNNIPVSKWRDIQKSNE